MHRFRLINSQLRRAGLFLAMVLTLVLATLPTAVLAAPAASDYRRDHDCGDCYVVQRGDTLSEIAKWFGVSTWELARYNGISNPSKIFVGQKLRIPPSRGHDRDCWDKDCGGHDKKWDDQDCWDKDCGGHDKKWDDQDCWDKDCGGHDKKWDDQDCEKDCGWEKQDHNKGWDCGGCGGWDKGRDDKDCDDRGCGSHRPHCGHNCHVVQPGDTLSQIAKWYGVSVDYLCRKNNIHNPSKIFVGQVIYI